MKKKNLLLVNMAFFIIFLAWGEEIERNPPLCCPECLVEKARSLENKLKALPEISDAVVYDYDDAAFFNNDDYFRVQIFLRNGDVIYLQNILEDLSFRKNTRAGVYKINKTMFLCTWAWWRLFDSGVWCYIPLEDLASVMNKGKYENVADILTDYDRIKDFLLNTPYGTKCGIFSHPWAFYKYHGTEFWRAE